MSHTFSYGKTHIHYNSDFSGDVHIMHEQNGVQSEIEIPCQVLIEFAANFVRGRRIAELETASPETVLGLKG